MSPIHNKYLGSHLSSFSGGTASVCFISPHCHRRRRRRRRCFLFALDFLEKKFRPHFFEPPPAAALATGPLSVRNF